MTEDDYDDDSSGDDDSDLLAALAASVSTSDPTIAPVAQVLPHLPQRPPPFLPASAAARRAQSDAVPPAAAAVALAPATASAPTAPKSASSLSPILVSPRQRGNPVLGCIRGVAWEYGEDVPADYVLGANTCALFLSLKYHRLHPEYIYGRIRPLQQTPARFGLRLLLVLVDIPNHEDGLRELTKTAVVHRLTTVLAWSAPEAARYLELYRAYERASPAAIRGATPAAGYAARLVDFVTAPRSIHSADAVALVSHFGSLRAAINAGPDQVAAVAGWGEVKVRKWCRVVEQPFRTRRPDTVAKAANTAATTAAITAAITATATTTSSASADGGSGIGTVVVPDPDEESAATNAETLDASSATGDAGKLGLTPGVAAALAKLRQAR